MKKQKVSDHDHTVNTTEPNAEIKARPIDQDADEPSTQKQFIQLRQAAASIRLKRKELRDLNVQWKALHGKIMPLLADPNLDDWKLIHSLFVFINLVRPSELEKEYGV